MTIRLLNRAKEQSAHGGSFVSPVLRRRSFLAVRQRGGRGPTGGCLTGESSRLEQRTASPERSAQRSSCPFRPFDYAQPVSGAVAALEKSFTFNNISDELVTFCGLSFTLSHFGRHMKRASTIWAGRGRQAPEQACGAACGAAGREADGRPSRYMRGLGRNGGGLSVAGAG
jgi:hypothetical protein